MGGSWNPKTIDISKLVRYLLLPAVKHVLNPYFSDCTWDALSIASSLALACCQHFLFLLLLTHRELEDVEHVGSDWVGYLGLRIVFLAPADPRIDLSTSSGSVFFGSKDWIDHHQQRISVCPMDTASSLLHHIYHSHSVWNHCDAMSFKFWSTPPDFRMSKTNGLWKGTRGSGNSFNSKAAEMRH